MRCMQELDFQAEEGLEDLVKKIQQTDLTAWMKNNNSTGYKSNYARKLISLVKRPGIEDLKEYLDTTDYYYAPASANWHGNYIGGLADHSVNVTMLFIKTCSHLDLEMPVPVESCIVCGLLHDLCKVDYYRLEYGAYKSVKNHPARTGHAKLSIEIIEKYIKLTTFEKNVILYHMGLFGVYGSFQEYITREMHLAIARNCAIQLFAACDTFEAHI